MKTVKLKKIEVIELDEPVYNLELVSNEEKDDLFWIEQTSGVVTHNCLPKDSNNFVQFAEKIFPDEVVKAAIKINDKVRTNRDWEKMEGRAVIHDV